MEYTLGTLKTILKKRLQDEDFDDDALTTFINQAQDEILGEDKYPFMQRLDTYVADATGEISLPPAYAGTFQIFVRKKKEPRRPLQYLPPDDFFNNTKAHSMAYTIYANTIFYRINEAKDNEDFEILHLYLENPRPLIKDTDHSPIPSQYMEALILGALYRAEQLRDNFDYAQLYQNQQDQILTNMKMRVGAGPLNAANQSKLPFHGGAYYDVD